MTFRNTFNEDLIHGGNDLFESLDPSTQHELLQQGIGLHLLCEADLQMPFLAFLVFVDPFAALWQFSLFCSSICKTIA